MDGRRRPTMPSGQTRRARLLFSRVGGCSATDTARLVHVSRATVHNGHRRSRAEGLAGLVDRRRSGRPTVLDRHPATPSPPWRPPVLDAFGWRRLSHQEVREVALDDREPGVEPADEDRIASGKYRS